MHINQGGLAASLLNFGLKPEEILILNIDTNSTNHNNLLQREMGFRSYFVDQGKGYPSLAAIKSGEDIEPALEKIFQFYTDIKGVYVPNSRVWRVADYMDKIGRVDIKLIGYDLTKQNIPWLKRGAIDFPDRSTSTGTGIPGCSNTFQQTGRWRSKSRQLLYANRFDQQRKSGLISNPGSTVITK